MIQADIHGQGILNYRHSSLNDEQTARFMIKAFDRDFQVNGPSTVRIVRTGLAGWSSHKDHPDPRVRNRIRWESRNLAGRFSALAGAAEIYYRDNPATHAKMLDLVHKLHSEFGLKSRFYSAVGGRWILASDSQGTETAG